MAIDNNPRLESDIRYPNWSEWPGSVLLYDEIKYYSQSADIPHEQHLIDPFEEEHLGAARYNLRLGPIAHVDGERIELSEDRTELVLPPHVSAVVQTLESVRLPRFLIARWNLKVSMVYEGLLWTGALQVDPGWHGQLVCPIYNLANRVVRLNYRNELFAMDFVRTTPFRPGVSKPFEQKRGSIEQYDRHRIRSAPYSTLTEISSLRRDVDDTSAQVNQLTNRLIQFAVLLFTVLAVIIATIGLLVAGQSFQLTISIPVAASFIMSGLALILSTYILFRKPLDKK